MSPTERIRRMSDANWFKAVQILGIPTVLCLVVVGILDRDRQAERADWRAQNERSIAAFVELRRSIDASTEANRLVTVELGRLSERVRQLEEMGARAMAARQPLQHQHPTTGGKP